MKRSKDARKFLELINVKSVVWSTYKNALQIMLELTVLYVHPFVRQRPRASTIILGVRKNKFTQEGYLIVWINV